MGAPKEGDVLDTLVGLANNEPGMLERYPILREMYKDPACQKFAKLTLADAATMSDEELIEVQAPIDRYYGFFLSVESLGVIMRELLKRLEPAKTVVDVGCGPCQYTAFLLARKLLKANRVLAIDPSLTMLVRAREVTAHENIGPTTVLIRAWGHALPVEDGVSNLTLCIDSLHWMSRWKECLREMARITAPGGKIFICYSTHAPRRRIPTMDVLSVLASDGMDIDEILDFGAEASRTPRCLIFATKRTKRKLRGIVVLSSADY